MTLRKGFCEFCFSPNEAVRVRRVLGNGKPGENPVQPYRGTELLRGHLQPPSMLCPTLGGPLEGPHLIHIISQLKTLCQTLPRMQPYSLGLPGTQEELQGPVGSCFIS